MMLKYTLSLLAASALTTSLAAQIRNESKPDPAPSFDLATEADDIAIGQIDGAWWGTSRSYEARFDAGGLRFRPNSVDTQERSVHFEFQSARRGRDKAWLAGRVAPEGDIDRGVVSYRREGLQERYDLRRDEVKQSFVFDKLPPGRGDLIVSLRITSSLECDSAGRADEGFAFTARGLGSITVGRVVGIDANGRRSSGWIRVLNDRVELGLPAKFVNAAALPLILDPPIGSTFPVIAGDNQEPDVAYDSTSSTYLVVWRVDGATRFARARRVSRAGLPIGGSVLLGTTSALSSVRVANIRASRSFVAVFESGDVLKARRVLASGTVGNLITVTRGQGLRFDIGGDSTTSDNDAVVVWADSTRILRGAQIEDSPSRGFHVFGTKTIASGGFNPSIAKSGGKFGRYLVTWSRHTSPGSMVQGAIIDRNLTPLDSLVPITPAGGSSESFSTVDGDGLQWVVAYTRFTSGEYDVVCRSVQFYPPQPAATFVGPEMVIEADPGDREGAESVAWMGDSAIVSYLDRNSGQNDVYCKTVDPFTCTICEREFELEAGPESTYSISSASTFSGAGADERALIVWNSDTFQVSSSPIRARHFIAHDGVVRDVGGGCGNGGMNYATCARVGNSAFQFQVRDAFNATCLLILGPDRIDAACGSCRLVPDPMTSVMVMIPTNSLGRAKLAVPIPSKSQVRNLKLYSQWFLFTNAGACTRLPGNFSNALEIQIQ